MKILPCDEIGCPTTGVSQPLRFREVCLFPPQFLRQQLLLCNVNCGSVKCFKNSAFKNRNTHAPNVTYVTVWPNNPFGHITTTALFMHHPDGALHRGTVIRVDGGQIPLKAWGPDPRVKAKNFVHFVRPIDAQIVSPTDTQILCGPAPHMGEALSFA